MASPQMVDTILELSRRLGNALGILDDGVQYESIPSSKDKEYFLFELKVLFSLLEHLASHGWEISATNKQMDKITLPRSPGHKGNFTYFCITNKETGGQWQVVHGTQIRDPFDEERAPDISLQRSGASTSPTFKDVVAIWDAKFRGHGDKKADDKKADDNMNDAEYRSFVWVRDKLKIPRPHSSTDPLVGWPPAYEVSALITNGDGPTENERVLLEDAVSVTCWFKDADSPTYPSREKHRSHI